MAGFGGLPSAATFLTTLPTGTTPPSPLTSNINLPIINGVANNHLIIQPGASGQVRTTNPYGSVHVFIDVEGYFQ